MSPRSFGLIRRWNIFGSVATKVCISRNSSTTASNPLSWIAAEFLSKKDYADNWRSEMNEEFCFWNFAQWKQALRDAGFSIIENAQFPTAGSRTYTNQWVVDHRYRNHIELLNSDPRRREEAVPWPPTNMVLIGEKNSGEIDGSSCKINSDS